MTLQTPIAFRVAGACARRALGRGAAGLLALFLVTAGPAAHAATVTIQTLQAADGAPLPGAAVCLGTLADPTQFGVDRSDGRGLAVFGGVPDAGLVLTVSKTNFSGERRVLPAGSGDRAYSVQLQRGGSGPRCAAATPGTAAAPGLRLLGVRIDGGARVTHRRDVRLELRVQGAPTEYRASESARFTGASWRPFVPRPRFELSAAPGIKRVYVQIRRRLAGHGASVVATSRVAAARIELVR